MEYFAKAYDVAVIGAGHAGIEAGLAAARLGCSTAVFTINMDWVGNMIPPSAAPLKVTWCERSTHWAAKWARRRIATRFNLEC